VAAADRPEVRVVDPRAPGRQDVLTSGAPRSRRWGGPLLVLVVAAGALLVRHAQQGPELALGTVRLEGDGTLSVPLVNRGTAVRVSGVSVRAAGLTATTPGSLAEEVAAADARGLPPAHDPARPLAPGRHTLLLGVRAACPDRPVGTGQLLVDVAGERGRRTLAAALPGDVRARLRCVPLSVRAGVSPVAPTRGSVGLLLTAHAGQPQTGGTFLRLAWPGYQVSGVGGVVPLALGWAAADTNVVFNAVVTPDCGSAPVGGLTAVFADRSVPVPLTSAAAARVQALRSGCP
jgi:hypothetical protein